MALYDFLTDVDLDEKYKSTQRQLYEILNLSTVPMHDFARELDEKPFTENYKNQLKDMHRQTLKKELLEIPQDNLKYLLGSIATLASKTPSQNSNQQLT